MRNFTFLTIFFSLYTGWLHAQSDTLTGSATQNISAATFKTKEILVDLGNSEEVDLVLKKIHTFRYLESLVLEGEASENTLKKIIYRISSLKNLSNLTLKENGLSHAPENMTVLKNLRCLTVEGNPELDYAELFTSLKTLPLPQLNLLDNDLKKVPLGLGEMYSLRKLQVTGSAQLDYAGLFDQLSKLPSLNTLSISVNYMSELPGNIDKLRSLQVLDVSENNLTELPQELSALKAINNLSIQGNLLMDPVKDLGKLKGISIKYLALDKEIEGEDLENIKKLFPEAQIDFPISKEEQEELDLKKAEAEKEAEKPVYNGKLQTKKEARILSGAYLLYPLLIVPYNFDTLTFEQRYRDLRYENTYQRMRGARITPLYFRRRLNRNEHKGDKNETWFYISGSGLNYLELGAFSGMYWVYKGGLSKKQFRKKYVRKKVRPERRGWFGMKRCKRSEAIYWNDIRIEYDKNGLFTIEVKTDTGFAKFTAYPRFAGNTLENSQKAYLIKYNIYQKMLMRRMLRFKRGQLRSRSRYDLAYRNMKDYAWKELQLRMSDEEKLMDKEEWLSYFDEVIANEQSLIERSPLLETYILRDLTLREYRLLPAATQSQTVEVVNTGAYGYKRLNIDFIDSKGTGKLAVSKIFIIDSKNKTIDQVLGTLGVAPNQLTLKQFASCSILVEMRNGNWGIVSPEEIDRQALDQSKTYKFSTRVFDKNLDVIGDMMKAAIN